MKIIDNAINIGKIKSIIKLNITLKLRINIKKYNLAVVFKFNIAIFEEEEIASKTFLLFKTISNLL
jgi:hypothetical protein